MDIAVYGNSQFLQPMSVILVTARSYTVMQNSSFIACIAITRCVYSWRDGQTELSRAQTAGYVHSEMMYLLEDNYLVYRLLSGTAPSYLATAVSSSLMRLDVGQLEDVSSDGLTASSVTDALPLHAPSCGTVFQFN